MLSRTAACLYWMNRYLERAESIARLVESTVHLSLDLPAEAEDAWEALVASSGDLEPFTDRFGAPTRDAVLRFLAFDAENPNSVLSSVRNARENARQVREHLPFEAWEKVNSLYLAFKGAAASDAALTFIDDALGEVRAAGRMVEGYLQAAFAREEGWYFGELGRACERADQTSRLIDAHYALLPPLVVAGGSALRWEGVLKSASATQVYRRRWGATDGLRVTEMLILDPAFPRSLAFCLAEAEHALRAITGTPEGQFRNQAEKALGKLAAELRYTEMDDILRKGLHLWLDSFQEHLNEIGQLVDTAYFNPASAGTHTPPGPSPLPDAEPEELPTQSRVEEEEQQQQ
jgi:uncharacterized alpha-E superfamily protein